jgi:hypothetical protein
LAQVITVKGSAKIRNFHRSAHFVPRSPIPRTNGLINVGSRENSGRKNQNNKAIFIYIGASRDSKALHATSVPTHAAAHLGAPKTWICAG